MAANDLFALAQEFLQACDDALTEIGNPIANKFVSPGLPAFDCCPQLNVQVGGAVLALTRVGTPATADLHRIELGLLVQLVPLACWVIRCAPVSDNEGEPPPAAVQEARAQESVTDLWAIINHTKTAYRAGLLFPSDDGKRELYIDPPLSIDPQGGCVGWQIPIRVQLDGYRTS